jgi:cadmium resistance protein CadD (predicted permease)
VQNAIVIFVFGAMTIVWCIAARWVVAHRAIGAFLRSAGPIVVPVVLIVLGVSILYASGAGTLLVQFVQ